LVLASAAPVAADTAPAYMVRDLNTAAVEESDSAPLRFVTRDGVAYFTADDGLHGTELWRSDGSAAGTRMVADIDPGSGSSNPRDLTVIGDAIWFRAWDGRHGCGVWRTDGSEAGTQNVAVVHTTFPRCFGFEDDTGTPTAFTAVGDQVFFVRPHTGARARAVAQRRHRRRHRAGDGHLSWRG
jgi:ELWxxDGT repeat protein